MVAPFRFKSTYQDGGVLKLVVESSACEPHTGEQLQGFLEYQGFHVRDVRLDTSAFPEDAPETVDLYTVSLAVEGGYSDDMLRRAFKPEQQHALLDGTAR